MSKLSNAVDQLHAWAEQQRAIVDLADALKDVASVDLAADEAQARLVAARTAEVDAQGALGAVQAQIAEAARQRDEILAHGSTKARTIIDAASAEASSIVGNANNLAAETLAQAVAQAKGTAQDADRRATAANVELAAAKTELAATNEALQAAKIELSSFQEKIAKARAQIEQMLK